jgi:DNA polymerase III alpha subunit
MYLNCHSYYSLHYGTLSIEELTESAARMGIKRLALTDINNSAGIPDFVRLARQKGIHAVAGMEFRRGDRLLYVCLARNPEGFSEINRYETEIRQGKTQLSDRAPKFQHVFAVYPLENLPESLRKNEFAGIRPSQAGRLLRSTLPPEKRVVLQPVTFADESDFYLHQNLRAIEHNLLLSRLKPEMTACKDEIFMPPAAIKKAFEPYPEVMENTHRLLEQCHIHFDFPKNKICFTPSPEEDLVLLEKLTKEGFEKRYGKENTEARQRLEKELQMIGRLGFAAYFLITHDIVQYAISQAFTTWAEAAEPTAWWLIVCTSPTWTRWSWTFISNGLSTQNAVRRPISTWIFRGKSGKKFSIIFFRVTATNTLLCWALR